MGSVICARCKESGAEFYYIGQASELICPSCRAALKLIAERALSPR